MSRIDKFFLFCMLFILSACSDTFCYEADDFGFSHVRVTAHTTDSEVKGSQLRQYVDWQDSGLTLSGNDVVMQVKHWNPTKNVNNQGELSAWCPWLGPAKNPPSLAPICSFFTECIYRDNMMCTDGNEADIINAPCIMKNGRGLYYLLAPKGFDPNATELSSRTPQNADSRVLHGHLGETFRDPDGTAVPFYDVEIDPYNSGWSSQASRMVRVNGVRLKLTPGQKSTLRGGKLYFKILDNYHQDNSGQYIVTIKSGITESEWDPMKIVTDIVEGFFFGEEGKEYLDSENGVITNIFLSVVTNPSYRLAVSSLLTAMIIFYAFNFAVGNVQITQLDLITRIIKVIVVSQLLTAESAWTFFNDYFFSYFLNGMKQIISIIKEAGGVGPGPSTIFGFMTNPVTLIKLSSLMFAGGVETFFASLAYIIIYIIAFMIIFLGLCYSGIVYITCIVMIGLLITLAPLFLCFILFDFTKQLFDTWLRQIASYAIQPLIVIAAVTMFGVMLKHQIYSTLGFRVCKNEYLKLNTQNAVNQDVTGKSNRNISLYFYQPRYSTTEGKTEILIPEGHFEGQETNFRASERDEYGAYCEPYECKGQRYISFPFLNPDNPTDEKRLDQFRSGDFLPFDGLFMLLISGVLLFLFMLQALKIGQFITGGHMDITSTTQAAAVETYQGAKVLTKGALKTATGITKGGYKLAKFIVKKALKSKKSDDDADSDGDGVAGGDGGGGGGGGG